MSALDLDDLHTQSGGLHSLLWTLYEVSTELDYLPDSPGFAAACRLSNLLILARDEAERLNANVGECITSQKRDHKVTATVAAPQVYDGPIFEPAKLSMEGLFALHAGVRTVLDVANGLCCQPKFCPDHDLSPSGEMMDKLTDFLIGTLDDIHTEALSRVPASDGERERQFFFIADRYVDGSTAPKYAMDHLKKEIAKIGGAKPVRMTGGNRNG